MAKKLDSYEFPKRGIKRYWPDEWFNGEIWHIEPKTESNPAKKHFNMALHVDKLLDGSIVFQAYKPEPKETSV